MEQNNSLIKEIFFTERPLAKFLPRDTNKELKQLKKTLKELETQSLPQHVFVIGMIKEEIKSLTTK